MAWIESHQGLARHIKTKRLARRLKISIPATIGHLHLLWWWAMDNLPDGRLTALEPEDIADEMMWDGDAGDLLEALHETGFVDQIGKDLYIHDWYDYIGRLLERRKKETERKRKYRKTEGQPEDIPSTYRGCPAGHDADDTRDGGSNSTVQYSTVPYQEEDIKPLVTTDDSEIIPKPKKPRKKKEVIPKIQFAEFVFLTTDEHTKLLEKYGPDQTTRMIEILDNYKGSSGKKYDSDYRTILNWVVKRYEEEQERGGSRGKFEGHAQKSGSGKPEKESQFAFLDVSSPSRPIEYDPNIF